MMKKYFFLCIVATFLGLVACGDDRAVEVEQPVTDNTTDEIAQNDTDEQESEEKDERSAPEQAEKERDDAEKDTADEQEKVEKESDDEKNKPAPQKESTTNNSPSKQPVKSNESKPKSNTSKQVEQNKLQNKPSSQPKQTAPKKEENKQNNSNAKKEEKPKDEPKKKETPKPKTEEKPKEESKSTVEVGNSSLEDQVVQLVNAERKKHGLSALSKNSTVVTIARNHSKKMAESGSLYHSNFGNSLKNNGVGYRTAGENVAYGTSPFSPQSVVQSWMNSPGHKANILNENFTHIGVGYAKSDKFDYWTQIFYGN